MDAEISQSEQWLRFVAWLEDNWQRVAAIGAVVIGIGMVIAFFIWQGGQKERDASTALSLLLVESPETTGELLAGFAQSHTGTAAGTRSRLLAGGAFFVEQQYEAALAEFERFQSEPGAGPLIPEARLGIAACREAQGHTETAVNDYRAIVDNPANGNVIPQARFALARLYLGQGLTEMARAEYEELANMPGLSLAAEARARLLEMPEPVAVPTTEIPSLTIPSVSLPADVGTNQP